MIPTKDCPLKTDTGFCLAARGTHCRAVPQKRCEAIRYAYQVARKTVVSQIFDDINQLVDLYLCGEIMTAEFDERLANLIKKYKEDQT